MTTTLEDALAEATRNSRVCPVPAAWMVLFFKLPPDAEGGRPPLPLVLGAPELQRSRLREHVEWAAAHGGLDEVIALLRELPEDRWIHAGSMGMASQRGEDDAQSPS